MPRAKCGPWFIVISEQINHAFSRAFPWVFPALVGCCKCFRASSMRLSTVPLKACGGVTVELQPVADHIPPFLSIYFKLDMIFIRFNHLANNNVQKFFQIGIIAGVFNQTVCHIHFGNHAAGRSQGDQNCRVPTGPRCVPRCNGCALPAQQTSALVKGKRRGDQNGTYPLVN